MLKIGLFYGSDTGNTMEVAEMIKSNISNIAEIRDVGESGVADFDDFDMLILGIPTWYYGEVQTDWDDYLEEIEGMNLDGKIIALFGCGDQEDYSEYFLDAMGTLRDIVVACGATIIGHWPCVGYDFKQSKAKVNDTHFVGLGIDFDRQPEMTESRVNDWCEQLLNELQVNAIP